MGRKRNPWVRLYTKILQCLDYMEAEYYARIAWIAIICYASDCNDGGRLASGTKPLNPSRLARLANITIAEAEASLGYFVECGMLVLDDDDVYYVANWNEYQMPSDNSSARVARTRENCNGEKTVTVTVQEEEVERDEEAEACADLLEKLISENLLSAGMKERNLNPRGWYSDIEKLHRIDGVEYDLIRKVIKWCQQDSFWKMNILSGAKLRKQFPRLVMQMSEEHTSGGHVEVPQFV